LKEKIARIHPIIEAQETNHQIYAKNDSVWVEASSVTDLPETEHAFSGVM